MKHTFKTIDDALAYIGQQLHDIGVDLAATPACDEAGLAAFNGLLLQVYSLRQSFTWHATQFGHAVRTNYTAGADIMRRTVTGCLTHAELSAISAAFAVIAGMLAAISEADIVWPLSAPPGKQHAPSVEAFNIAVEISGGRELLERNLRPASQPARVTAHNWMRRVSAK